uniref:Uncharacterized protein n=1 Tax=Cacopsylla melanoneura TaxID=428564 RepID=A0A8D8R1S9_9HEMI
MYLRLGGEGSMLATKFFISGDSGGYFLPSSVTSFNFLLLFCILDLFTFFAILGILFLSKIFLGKYFLYNCILFSVDFVAFFLIFISFSLLRLFKFTLFAFSSFSRSTIST